VREHDGLDSVAEVELLEDVRHVRLHGGLDDQRDLDSSVGPVRDPDSISAAYGSPPSVTLTHGGSKRATGSAGIATPSDGLKPSTAPYKQALLAVPFIVFSSAALRLVGHRHAAG
jgi:hypothetical protein